MSLIRQLKYYSYYYLRYTDEEVCQFLLKNSALFHLNNDQDKFNLLAFMVRKLFAFAHGKCAEEGMDPVMMQEITLPGHLYLQLLKDRIASWLSVVKFVILKRQNLSNNFIFNSGKRIEF
jgi:DNA-directed RNA polymerase I subunit RPA2